MENNKRFTVQINPELAEPKEYGMFLVRFEEKGLDIQFADQVSDSDEVRIHVKDRVLIRKDIMRRFLLDIYDAMLKYEDEYKNNCGMSRPTSQVEEASDE